MESEMQPQYFDVPSICVTTYGRHHVALYLILVYISFMILTSIHHFDVVISESILS